MNCKRIETLIPLYVEGNLEPEIEEAVLSHLKSCAGCGKLAEEYAESQSSLRLHAPPDFNEAFYAGIRHRVLSEIEIENSRPSFFQSLVFGLRWKPALAALMLMIIFGSVAIYFLSDETKPQIDSVELVKDEKPGEENPQPAKTPEEPYRIDKDNVAKNEDQKKSTGPARRKVPRRTQPEPELPIEPLSSEDIIAFDPFERYEPPVEDPITTGATAPEGTTRIEIQTSDPNIRIIWFAPKKVDPNSSIMVIDTIQEVLCF